MAKVSDTVVRIRGEETVSKASKQARGSLDKLDKRTQESNKKGAANWKGLATKAGIYGAAIAGVVVGVKNLVSAYAEQEAAERRLSQAVENNPFMDRGAADRIQRFAEELQEVSTVSDSTATSLASMLATAGRTEEQIKDIISVAADYSAAVGIDMQRAVEQLNATFTGEAGEIEDYVNGLDDLTREQLQSGEAIDLLREKVEGQAEAMRDTAQGGMKSFANAWTDLKEQLGGFADTVVSPIISGLTNMVEAFNDATGAIRDFIQRREDMKALEEGSAGQAQQRRALEAQLSQITEEMERSQRELEEVRRQTAEQLVSMGIERGTEQFRQAMEQEIKPYEQALESAIRQQSTTAQRIAALEREAQSSGAQAGEESLSEDQRRIQQAVANIRESFSQLEEQAEIPGREMDLFAEKQKVLNSAIDDLIYENFTASGGGIQYIIDLFGQYLEEVAIATKRYGQRINQSGPQRVVGGGQVAQGRYGDSIGGGGPETIVSGSIADAIGGGGGGPLDMFLSALGDASGEFGDMIAATSEFQAILNPITTILKSAFETIAPAFLAAVEPLVDILGILGQVLGTILIPYYEVLGRITKEIGKAFVWLHNSVIRPVGNFMLDVFETVGNFFVDIARNIINALNKIPGVNLDKPGRFNFDRIEKLDSLEDWDADSDTDTSTDSDSSSPVYGGNTTTRQPPDIYVSQYFNGPVIGEAAMEQVGEFVVDAIQAYAGAGGDVSFEEATA